MSEKNQTASHPFTRLQLQLADIIAATPAGGKLLSEPQLAEKLGVSRATLREGMRTFEAKGMIRRRQGIGTFVEPQLRVIESGLEVLESIERQANRIGLEVSMGELRVIKELATPEMAEKLQVEENSALITISRVIHAGERPVAYLVDTLPPDVLSEKDARGADFNGSVLDFLIRRGEPGLSKSFTDIQAVAAEAGIAKKLQIQRGDVLLQFTARLYSTQGRILDFSFSYFLPGYFRFHVIRNVENRLPK